MGALWVGVEPGEMSAEVREEGQERHSNRHTHTPRLAIAAAFSGKLVKYLSEACAGSMAGREPDGPLEMRRKWKLGRRAVYRA